MKVQGRRPDMDVNVDGNCTPAVHVDCLHAKAQPGAAKDSLATARHATQDAADLGRTKKPADITMRLPDVAAPRCRQ